MILKIMKKIILFTLVVSFLLSAWFFFEFTRTPKSSPERITVELQKGASVNRIAQELKTSKIIRKKWVFLLGYHLFFSPKSLKAGEYRFTVPLPVKSVLQVLTVGMVYLHPITVPEGLTRTEIAGLLQSEYEFDKEAFLSVSSDTQLIFSLDKKAEDLEGYLFPETYSFPKGTSEEKIVSAMVSHFKEVFNGKWENQAKKLGMSIREVVTLASLIEKETSILEEKSLVSAVFHNRLRKGMKLDCDPTIIYALKLEGRFKGRLHTKDMKLASPYNTYLHAGLPPGPIANPGRDSLEAALFPARKGYLYFVSKNDGSHQFSESFREHQRAVFKYQKRMHREESLKIQIRHLRIYRSL